MGMGQNLVPLVNIKIACKWMFIALKMAFIGIDPWPDIGQQCPFGKNGGAGLVHHLSSFTCC